MKATLFPPPPVIWMLTQDEYHDYLLDTDEKFLRSMLNNRKYSHWTDAELNNTGIYSRGGYALKHRLAVESALKRGCNVPANVLLDYPEFTTSNP